MELEDAARTVNMARGYAELGMYEEAWHALESLPPSMQLSAPVVALRLLVFAGLQKWEQGAELAKIVTPRFPREVREAAGRCHLARAESLCVGGDLDGAKEAVKALMSIWPEGRQAVVKSKAWECL